MPGQGASGLFGGPVSANRPPNGLTLGTPRANLRLGPSGENDPKEAKEQRKKEKERKNPYRREPLPFRLFCYST